MRFGLREATIADADILTIWLRDHVASEVGGDIEPMLERLEGRSRELAIEPPTPDRMKRIARSVLRAHRDRFYDGVYERLPPATRKRLDALLRPEKSGNDKCADDDAQGDVVGSVPAVVTALLPDQHIGRAGGDPAAKERFIGHARGAPAVE